MGSNCAAGASRLLHARGILEAIYWKPATRLVIDRIHILKPIRFENVRRNTRWPQSPHRRRPPGNDARRDGRPVRCGRTTASNTPRRRPAFPP